MKVNIADSGRRTERPDALAVFVFKDELAREFPRALAEKLPWLENMPGWLDFKGSKDDCAVFYGPKDAAAARVIALGLGEKDKFNLEALRCAAGTALRKIRSLRLKRAGYLYANLLSIPGDTANILEEAVLGGLLGLYTYDQYRSKNPDAFDVAELLITGGGHMPETWRAAVRRAENTAAGISLTRDLANAPSNILTPKGMEAEARALAQRHGFTCSVLDEDALREKGMGAFVSVLQGSAEGGRLIILEHAPQGLENQTPLVFIGKGITFDTGGISLKPAAGMHRMKSDMAGAAAVMGALEIIGREKTPRRIIGMLACAENMPGGKASRPGDVVTCLNGKTVEITNTDAEGRLVLCDSLVYAQKHFKPEIIVDIATLTGACVVALGENVAGLFTEDEALEKIIRAGGERSGDKFWPLPLWDSYFEAMKSEVADMVNAGAREGGAINAGLFLKQFIEPGLRWAHLDIAGPAFLSAGTPLRIPGATGFGVRALLDLAGKV